MPRRLALLIFLYTVLTYATEPTPDNTHAPVKLVAIPHQDVFVPLKEWKRQRLQDLESRVRKAEEKPVSPRRKLSEVCKPRARLLAFLSRLDVCPPSTVPTVTPQPTSDDPYWVSAKHAYGDVNISAQPTETALPSQLQPSPKPAVSPLVEQQVDDSHLPESLQTTSVQPSPDTRQEKTPAVSVEPDELTGRIEDYIPKVLPNVLPNVIPKVGQIVKSLKEASLAYTASDGTPPDALNRNGNSSNSGAAKGNTTSNATSHQATQEKSSTEEPSISQIDDRRASPKTDKDAGDNLVEDEHMLNVIVKHSIDSGAKEKPFNYASIDAGARVLAFSNGVVGATNVIVGSNDKYLLSPCAGSGIAGSRFVDLELSEEVILESIETANFEYYSSSPRKIAVLGASTYPPKKWNVLGIFDFADVKTLQKFQIEKRGVTRYLRVIFAGKQGTEYYCPISTVRAFGKNLLADWKEVLDKPAATRKSATESGSGSKSKTDKETDRSKINQTTNGRKVEANPSERTEKCSGDGCKDTTDTTIASERRSTQLGTAPEDEKNDMQRLKDVDANSGGSESEATGTEMQDEKAASENDSGTGDDASNSDRRADVTSNDDEQSDSDESVSIKDNGASRHANYGDSDHVSEDDQIVIDALRSDTLSPVDGDDNIFRKVTRMLRLLELNQTLTNQYIDTQLAKFAVALSAAHTNSRNTSERVEMMQQRLEILVAKLEYQIEELTRAGFRRDILLCILLVCVAFLLGTHWILWTTVSGARIHEETGLRRSLDSEVERIDRMLQTDDIATNVVARVEGISSEGPSPAGRKKKRKAKRPFAGENMNGGYVSGNKLSGANGLNSEVERVDRRSMSSFDISSNGHYTKERRRSGSTGGTFDVLGSMADQ